jgi:hypothetical protein
MNIKVIFFPANCTSRLQPLDLDVIHVTKGKYWKTLVQKAIAVTERKAELKLHVLQAMHVFMKFSKLCDYYNCFRKAGFVDISEQPAEGLDEKEMKKEDRKKVTPNPEIQFKDCELQ